MGVNTILGEMVIQEPKILADFVKQYNPDFDEAIAEAFINTGKRYAIKGDIAFCQSIIETGWFKFADGTAVTPDQHNYCGLGVLTLGTKGHSFDTIEQGVEAQFQHLYAYASVCELLAPKIDPRFDYVERGIAMHWEDLGGKWSSQRDYGDAILNKFGDLYDFAIHHNLYVPAGKWTIKADEVNTGTIAVATLQVKEFDSDTLLNDFLKGQRVEDIVQIKPFYVSNINGFRYAVTYKAYMK